MSVYPVFELSETDLNVRWESPYVSETLNRKFSAMVPEGIYYGYECEVDLFNSLLLHIKPDPARGESVAVVEQDTDLRSIFVRETSDVILDFTGHAVFPVLVVLETDYVVGIPTTGRIKVVDTLGDNQIILCRVYAGLTLDEGPRMIAPNVGNLYRPYLTNSVIDPCNDVMHVRPGHHVKSDRSGFVRTTAPLDTPPFAPNSAPAKVRYDLVSITDAGTLLITPGAEFPSAGITGPITHGPVPPLAAVSIAFVRITEGPGDPVCLTDEDITDIREWFNLGIPLGGIHPGVDTKDEGSLIKVSGKTYNFIGPGVVAAVDGFDPSQVNVTIPGGGGGGGSGTGTGCRVTPPGYIHGFMLESHPGDPLNKVRATRGIARNDDDDGEMIEEVTFLEADINLIAAGGLDFGVVTPDTIYFIWLIQDITIPAVPINALIFSLSSSLPILPGGYTKKRRIGSCKTHPVMFGCPSGIMRFRQFGDDQERITYYMETVSCASSYVNPAGWSASCLRTAFLSGSVSLGGGASAAFPLTSFVPSTSRKALVNFLYDANPFGALLLRVPGETNWQYKIDHRDTNQETWDTWQDWIVLDGTRIIEATGGNGPVLMAAGVVVGYLEDLRTEVVREDICGGNAGACLEFCDENTVVGASCAISTSGGCTPIPGFIRDCNLIQHPVNPDFQVQIGQGVAVSDDATEVMDVLAPITVNIAVIGPNGRDGGVENPNTLYHVFLIKDPGSLVVAGLISASYSAPALPGGFSVKRYIGSVRNDSGANFLRFTQLGCGCERQYIYNNQNPFVADTTVFLGDFPGIPYITLDYSPFIPPGVRQVRSNIQMSGQIPFFPFAVVPSATPNEAVVTQRPSGSVGAEWTIDEFVGSGIGGGHDYDTLLGTNRMIDFSGSPPDVPASSPNFIVAVMSYFEDLCCNTTGDPCIVASVPSGGGGGGGCGHIYGGNLVYLTGTTVTITTGCIRSDDDLETMLVAPVALTVDFTVLGVNGRDAGAFVDGLWHLFVIKNLTSGVVAGLASLSFSAPALPAGFSVKRRVGSVLVSGGVIFPFQQNGLGVHRRYWYMACSGNLLIFTGFFSNASVLMSVASYVPLSSREMIFTVHFNKAFFSNGMGFVFSTYLGCSVELLAGDEFAPGGGYNIDEHEIPLNPDLTFYVANIGPSFGGTEGWVNGYLESV